MGFLDRFRRRRAPSPSAVDVLTEGVRAKASAAEQVAAEKRYAKAFTSWLAQVSGDPQLLDAYGEDPWMTPTVALRSAAVGRVEWRLYRTKKGQRARELRRDAGVERSAAIASWLQGGMLEEVLSHDCLDLLAEPMPGMTGFEFWELASVYLDILGEDLFVKDRTRTGAPPRYLQIVNPTQLQKRPDVGSPFFEVMTGQAVKRIGVLDAIWSRRVNPADPWSGRGVGLGRALRDELATDHAMSTMARSRFKNHATPDLMIGLLAPNATSFPPGGDVVKAFAADFETKHKGAERAGSIHAVGGPFQVQQFGHTLVESQFVQGREFHRNTTMQGFSMPPEMLGVLDNANRSTIDAAETHFAKFSTALTLERFCASLQQQLVPEYGHDLVLGFTSPVPADREFKRSVMIALPRAFTFDDVRALAGEQPLPNGAGAAQYDASSAVPAVDKPKNTDPDEPKKAPAPEVEDEDDSAT